MCLTGCLFRLTRERHSSHIVLPVKTAKDRFPGKCFRGIPVIPMVRTEDQKKTALSSKKEIKMKIWKQLTAMGLAASLLLSLTACGSSGDASRTLSESTVSEEVSAETSSADKETSSGTEESSSEQEASQQEKTRDRLMGSSEACDVNVGLIMGPPSMGLGWFINEAGNGNTYNHYDMTVAGIDYSALAASLNENTYQIITCPSNVAAILYNNEDLQCGVKVISINNTGLLYIVTTDTSVETLEDLKGRTVYAIGEGGPPEYTFEYLMDKSGLSKDVNLSFRSTPFEVVNLLQDEENSIALLPQPFVEVAGLLVPDLKVPIDITAEWDKWNTDSQAESITTVSVVREDFLEAHEQAVVEYLNMAKQSTDYTLSHVEEAAAWTEEFETFLNPEVAVSAIPKCNICTITGEEMKEKLGGFINIMYQFNPDAVGGSIPDDDFYYIPPEA